MQVLKDDIRASIIKAASDEFYVKGYIGSSMRDIAKRAGVSLSNPYNYFPNKNELFSEVTTPMRNTITEIFNESVNSGFSTGNEFNGYAEKLAERLAQLSEENRKSIIILMEKSEGTESGMTKEEISSMLEKHFAEELGADDSCVYKLIASNFLSGILAILKEDNNLNIENGLKKYLKYHISGVASLKGRG